MKITLITIMAASLFLTACSSNRNSDSNDSLMTDTSMVDTMATDAMGPIDTAIAPIDTGMTDTPGVGSTPAPQP